MSRACLGLLAIVAALLGPASARGADEDEVQSLLIPVNALSDRQPEQFTVAVGDIIEFYAFGGGSPTGDALEFRATGQLNPRRMQVIMPPGVAAAGAAGQFGGMGGVGGAGGGMAGGMGGMGGMGGGMGAMMGSGMAGASPNRSLNCTVRIAGKGGPLERIAVLRRGMVDFYGETSAIADSSHVVTQGNGRALVSVPIGPLTLVRVLKPGKATVEVISELGKSRKEIRTFEITIETSEARQKRWADAEAEREGAKEDGGPGEEPQAKPQKRGGRGQGVDKRNAPFQ